MHRVESPRTDDSAIEQEIKDKGLTAPRVTPAELEANIASEHCFTADEGVSGASGDSASCAAFPVGHPLTLLTICVLVLRNGFTVVGTSACASPENFDADVGRKVARQNALQQVWPLMGYALKEKLASVPADYRDRVRAEQAELDERLGKLRAFVNGSVFLTLPADEQRRLESQLSGMQHYSHALQDRIAAFA